MKKETDKRMKNSIWIDVDEELSKAYRVREAGMEGKARVCARRAAGKAFLAAGLTDTPTLAGIKKALATHAFPSELVQICSNLTQPVDENFKLDKNIDLLADVIKLINSLKNQEFEKPGKG